MKELSPWDYELTETAHCKQCELVRKGNKVACNIHDWKVNFNKKKFDELIEAVKKELDN